MNDRQRACVFIAILLAAATTACATHEAPGVRGRWEPVNRFADATEAIPIKPPHVYYAAPVDATLKALLNRWAKDSNMTLSYRHPNDFTLYRPVADIRTVDVGAALAALNAAYAGQGVSISIEQRTIVVGQRPLPVPAGANP